MSKLPPPRNIRSNWKGRPIRLTEAAAELGVRFKFLDTYGEPIEARAWEMARGWRKGQLKRVDVAYAHSDGSTRIVSMRLTGKVATLRMGEAAAR